MCLNVNGIIMCIQSWELGRENFEPMLRSTPPGCALAGAGQASLSADGCLSAARWPHSVVCRVNGLYRQSQGVASSCHFLLLRLVSSRSQPCTSGANLPAGRVASQPHDCFLFLWRLRLRAARCWNGLEGDSPGRGRGAPVRSVPFVPPH